MRYSNQSPYRICPSCNMSTLPLPTVFLSCHVKSRGNTVEGWQSLQSHFPFSPLFSPSYSHLTVCTFSLMLHKPWILIYSSCYFNDPFDFAQRIAEEWLPDIPSSHRHLLIVSLLSMCSQAKNNCPHGHFVTGGNMGWLSQPCYARAHPDVRSASMVYWISVVAKGCVWIQAATGVLPAA